jgi:deoxyribonuclease V
VGTFAAADVYYPPSGGAQAAVVFAADETFSAIVSSATAVMNTAVPYQPGEFYRRELPALHAVLDDITNIDLLIIDGYVDLDPTGLPGLGAYAHKEFGTPVIGVAKSRFLTATHAIPVLRGLSHRPLFITAAGMPLPDAVQLVREMKGPHRIPDALRLVDTLTRVPQSQH